MHYDISYSLEEAEKKNRQWIYIEDILNQDVFKYGDVVAVINDFIGKKQEAQFLECQICSETEIDIKNINSLLNEAVDTEWSETRINFGSDIIWHPKKNETIINIEGLSETLVAVYYIQSDEYYLTIVSKEVFNDRRVSDDVLDLIIQISNGDMVLWDSDQYIGEKRFKEIVDYLVSSGYIFIIHKNLVDNMELITIKSTIDWKQKEKYSVEYTKKGRECCANNELGLEVTKFVNDISVD